MHPTTHLTVSSSSRRTRRQKVGYTFAFLGLFAVVGIGWYWALAKFYSPGYSLWLGTVLFLVISLLAPNFFWQKRCHHHRHISDDASAASIVLGSLVYTVLTYRLSVWLAEMKWDVLPVRGTIAVCGWTVLWTLASTCVQTYALTDPPPSQKRHSCCGRH